jgi:hypothetical protein
MVELAGFPEQSLRERKASRMTPRLETTEGKNGAIVNRKTGGEAEFLEMVMSLGLYGRVRYPVGMVSSQVNKTARVIGERSQC